MADAKARPPNSPPSLPIEQRPRDKEVAMRNTYARVARRMGIAVAVIMLAATGRLLAQQGPQTSGGGNSLEAQAAAVLDYWTPERMNSARPKPFPTKAVVARAG